MEKQISIAKLFNLYEKTKQTVEDMEDDYRDLIRTKNKEQRISVGVLLGMFNYDGKYYKEFKRTLSKDMVKRLEKVVTNELYESLTDKEETRVVKAALPVFRKMLKHYREKLKSLSKFIRNATIQFPF